MGIKQSVVVEMNVNAVDDDVSGYNSIQCSSVQRAS